MKLIIVFFLTVIIKCFVFGNSQEQWYKNQMETSVLPSYIQAYNKLQIGVLNELLTVNIASLDDTAVSQLANRLYCAVRETYTFLQQSISASQTLQDQVNVRLTSSLLQRSTYERNIADTENEIVQTNQALEGAINQLAVAENAVLEKQRAVAAADQVVRDAEDDVERARKCRGKRGGWISKITRPIVRPIENIVKDVIIKPICSVINEGGVSSAKSRRNDAESQLASARNQEQHYRQIVNEKAQLKNNLLNQLHEFQSSLFAIRAELEILQKEYSATANINTQLNQVTIPLANAFSSTTVLQSTITRLVDFESLINPLNAVYTSINQITNISTTKQINQNQVQQTKTSLAQINLLLPNMPFNLNTNFIC